MIIISILEGNFFAYLFIPKFMATNPFGDEANSVHAWKEKFKQQQFQTQTLMQQVGQIKAQLEDIQLKYEEVTRQFSAGEGEISEAKQELNLLKALISDRDMEILNLTSSIETNRMDKIEQENNELRRKVENLQGELIRGSSTNSATEQSDSIMKSLIHMMLKVYDPETKKFPNALLNIAEAVIQNGDTPNKIIGTLIKYDGNLPVSKIRELVNESDFNNSVNNLINGGLIVQIDDNLHLSSTSVNISNEQELDTLSTPELFDFLLEATKSQSDEDLVKLLENFRDVLQERNIPLTKIFFEIRKIMERLQRKDLSRKEVIYQIKSWQERYKAVS